MRWITIIGYLNRSSAARAAPMSPATGKRIVVVHVFAKEDPKTPRREIVTALWKRAKEESNETYVHSG